ncbi:hypothetical protein EV649_5636 [Kribbella sp. VKM Ac-2569]|uniref:hypothetical protein n=1 Tax=Kribbella sp. VKM Ac-2569 TaxID=2512220 RepID=UPI00102C41CC|nr:hypothetical protein [Kribbella sp. VKM Ac-2569]RZT14856.1 hypothetical protein EV649_5636 [Kribbella sp. VKM Ac-2569]
MRRALTALLAAPLALVAFPLAAQAEPDPALHITSVALNKTSVAVSGLNTAPVTVTVKGVFDTGSSTDEKVPVNVILERTGGTGQLRQLLSTNLIRNETTGTWSGPLNVPSTANGTFKVTGVMTGPFFPPSPPITDPTPYAGPSITVTGTHQPKITAVVTPKVVPFNQPYTIKWAVSDAQTGKPYGSRIRVALQTNSGCVEYFGPKYTNTTDTNGVVTKAYPGVSITPITCLLLPGTPDANGWLSFVPARPAIVSAAPSKTSAPVGTIVGVNGSVMGGPFNCPVHLQRLYGASQWRTVGSAAVRASGRFTLNAQPAYKGSIPYRVYFPACRPYVAGVSKVFYIRGT